MDLQQTLAHEVHRVFLLLGYGALGLVLALVVLHLIAHRRRFR